jgi:DNA-binding MarR family transcriptional regulator
MEDSGDLDAVPWQSLESVVMATSRAVRRAIDVTLEPLGLNLSHWLLLAVLEQFGPMSQTQLADQIAIGRAAAGSIVDGLHDRGLVKRDADPNDGRVWRVSLTRRGKEFRAKVVDVEVEFRSKLRAGLARDERRQLVKLLLHLQANALGVLGDLSDASDA